MNGISSIYLVPNANKPSAIIIMKPAFFVLVAFTKVTLRLKDKSINTPICGQPVMIMSPICLQPLFCSVTVSNAPPIVCYGDSTNISAYMNISGGQPVVSNNLNYYLTQAVIFCLSLVVFG